MQFTLSDYNQRQDYMDAIDNIQYKAGGTNTAAALNMIRNQGKLTTLSQKKNQSIFDSISIIILFLKVALHVNNPFFFLGFGGQGDRPHLKNIVVLLTDGDSNSFEQTVAEARATREAGIHIIVVSIGTWLNSIQVKEIASDPDSQSVYHVDSFDDLGRIGNSLKMLLCDGEQLYFLNVKGL